MPQINAYLGFDGHCAEAMRFYQSVLGGTLEPMMTYANSPMRDQLPPESAERIMHSQLTLDHGVLMAGDSTGCQPYEGMKGFTVTLTYPTADEAKSVFDQLAKGGKITMPLQKSFWAEAFGMVVDRFGTPWAINGGMMQH